MVYFEFIGLKTLVSASYNKNKIFGFMDYI